MLDSKERKITQSKPLTPTLPSAAWFTLPFTQRDRYIDEIVVFWCWFAQLITSMINILLIFFKYSPLFAEFMPHSENAIRFLFKFFFLHWKISVVMAQTELTLTQYCTRTNLNIILSHIYFRICKHPVQSHTNRRTRKWHNHQIMQLQISMDVHYTFSQLIVLYLMASKAERPEKLTNVLLLFYMCLKELFQIKARLALAQHSENKTEQ